MRFNSYVQKSILLFSILLEPKIASAFGPDFCDPTRNRCWEYSGRTTSSPAYPSTSSRITINPSAVPTDEGFGIETIDYKNQFDFLLVKGLGRVGAAISPTNGDESFFGPPGFEIDPVYLERKIEGAKYSPQKYALATSFEVVTNKREGLERFLLSVGLAGRYNKLTKNVWPGAGLSGILGPLTFGYSALQDETQIDESYYGLLPENLRYSTETYTVGLFLNSLALDWSMMRLYGLGQGDFRVNMLTASLLLPRFILTYSLRQETSLRYAYDPSTQSLVTRLTKSDSFVGIQGSITKTVMLSVFYNYYLLGDLSFGGTLFF